MIFLLVLMSCSCLFFAICFCKFDPVFTCLEENLCQNAPLFIPKIPKGLWKRNETKRIDKEKWTPIFGNIQFLESGVFRVVWIAVRPEIWFSSFGTQSFISMRYLGHDNDIPPFSENLVNRFNWRKFLPKNWYGFPVMPTDFTKFFLDFWGFGQSRFSLFSASISSFLLLTSSFYLSFCAVSRGVVDIIRTVVRQNVFDLILVFIIWICVWRNRPFAIRQAGRNGLVASRSKLFTEVCFPR